MPMSTGRGALFLVVALVAAVALGCQNGGDDKPADDTARQISDDDLAGMTLALADFGADYASFQAEDDNGLRTLEKAVEGDLDPEDERADLQRFGWASAYEGFYTNRQDAEESSGVYGVGSTVNLFETVQGAEGYVEDSRDELTTQVGFSMDTITVIDIQEFDAAVADEAVGAIVKVNVEPEQGSSEPIWMSAVMFRHGRLVAVVGAYTFQEPQLQDNLRTLALHLDQNIDRVLGASAAAR
jgi:hypothetical protein